MRVISILLVFICFGQITEAQTSIIQGEIEFETNDSLIYLFKAEDDNRGKKIEVSVNNNRFSFKIDDSFFRMYELILQSELESNQWKRTYFFNDQDTVRVLMNDSVDSPNLIEGGALNKKYQELEVEAVNKLQPKLNKVYNEMENLDSSQADAIKEKENELQSIIDEYISMKLNTIEDDTSVLGLYYLLLEILPSRNDYSIDNDWIIEQAQRYTELFPDHPYSLLMADAALSFSGTQEGSEYIDYKLPLYGGDITSLSSLVEGKYFVLNLWASWCGPCIEKSRDFVDIFNEYNGEQFTIIGTAREFINLNRYEAAIERERFPWVDLIELDDDQNIWWKYQVPYSGGAIFLVNDKGVIEKINPSADEVRKYLETVLD